MGLLQWTCRTDCLCLGLCNYPGICLVLEFEVAGFHGDLVLVHHVAVLVTAAVVAVLGYGKAGVAALVVAECIVVIGADLDITPTVGIHVGSMVVADELGVGELADKEVVGGVLAGLDSIPACYSCPVDIVQNLAGSLGTILARCSCPGDGMSNFVDHLPSRSSAPIPAPCVATLVFPYSTETMCLPGFC